MSSLSEVTSKVEELEKRVSVIEVDIGKWLINIGNGKITILWRCRDSQEGK